METVTDFIFLGFKITVDSNCSHEIKRCLLLGRKAMTNLDSILKSRDKETLLTKVYIVKAMVFPVIMYGCERWNIKKAECQRIDAFELWCWMKKTLESPLDSKEIKPVNSKGNQLWIFIGKTDAEAEAPILWPPDKSQLIGKDTDAEKGWRQEDKGATGDETVGWHHWLNGHNSRREWRTRKPGMLQSTGLQRVRHEWLLKSNNKYSLRHYLQKPRHGRP